MVNPDAYIIANVPMRETGIANSGIIAALQLWRNTIITSTTSTTASNMVRYRALMDSCTYSVVSYPMM